jgi:glutamate dehydrogenase/leucine dehydrogenase
MKILGIIDRDGGLIDEEGMGLSQIKQLFLEKQGNKLHADQLLPFEEVNQRIWDMGADIFIPGAASKLVTAEQVDRMTANGTAVIACGANVPFVDDGVFFGPTATATDSKIALIPDFIANCGMARVFAYFMEEGAEMTDEAIFGDVSKTIAQALEAVFSANPRGTDISKTALHLALERLMPEKEGVML